MFQRFSGPSHHKYVLLLLGQRLSFVSNRYLVIANFENKTSWESEYTKISYNWKGWGEGHFESVKLFFYLRKSYRLLSDKVIPRPGYQSRLSASTFYSLIFTFSGRRARSRSHWPFFSVDICP